MCRMAQLQMQLITKPSRELSRKHRTLVHQCIHMQQMKWHMLWTVMLNGNRLIHRLRQHHNLLRFILTQLMRLHTQWMDMQIGKHSRRQPPKKHQNSQHRCIHTLLMKLYTQWMVMMNGRHSKLKLLLKQSNRQISAMRI